MVRRGAVLAGMIIALAGAADAAALPGDPPFEPVSPPDGATFAPTPDGIPVSYTCPLYRQSTAGTGFTIYGDADDYGVSFATSPELGTDGRLRDDRVVALDRGHISNTVPEGQCVSVFASGGSQRPQETPGTYYWQVWRLCTGCEGSSYETGPVRRLVLKTAGRPELALPSRAYAGYAAIIGLRLKGFSDGARVTVQRRTGGGWRSLGTDNALKEQGEVVAQLPRGKQVLRAVAQSGDETITGPQKTLNVRPARKWRTRASDDGSYTFRSSVRFRVTGGGREIRDFQADVPMLCPGVVAGQLTTMIGRSAVKRIRIAPDGSFVGVASYGGDTTTLVRGRLSGRRVREGQAALSLGQCNGVLRFDARR